MSVDVNSHRLTSRRAADVGAIGLGQVFRLPMFTFPLDDHDNGNTSRVNPYACVGVPSVRKISYLIVSVCVTLLSFSLLDCQVVNVWRSTFLGISTNIAINFAYDDNYQAGAANTDVMQYGATLTYQGSVLNETVRVECSLWFMYF
jgi:hypothetical protein